MSQKYPECPLYNHSNCKDYEHPKLCAIVRKDKVCLKKKQKSKSQKRNRRSKGSKRDGGPNLKIKFFLPVELNRAFFLCISCNSRFFDINF